MNFVELLEQEMLLAEQEIAAEVRDYMADRMQGLFEGPYIPPYDAGAWARA